MAQHNWKLSPSDFAFLWEDCKRCFYLKIVSGFQRPRPIMPKIFGIIDNEMKAFFAGKRTGDFVTALPAGVVEYGEKWVESSPISISSHSSTCFVRGKFDTAIKFDDGTYGVVDFKTSERKAEHVPLYGRQLHAYALALENPAAGKLSLRPITRLGLLVFDPSSYSLAADGTSSLSGGLTWIEIPRDKTGFLGFLGEVLDVLEQPDPPGGTPSCQWCAYRDTSRRTRL